MQDLWNGEDLFLELPYLSHTSLGASGGRSGSVQAVAPTGRNLFLELHCLPPPPPPPPPHPFPSCLREILVLQCPGDFSERSGPLPEASTPPPPPQHTHTRELGRSCTGVRPCSLREILPSGEDLFLELPYPPTGGRGAGGG